jgi:hypothetical protein
MIRDVNPGSGFIPIPDQGVKKAPDPGSWIRNTVYSNVQYKHSFSFSHKGRPSFPKHGMEGNVIIDEKIITRKGFEVGLEETFPSPHLVHRLHAETVKVLKGQSWQFRKKTKSNLTG